MGLYTGDSGGSSILWEVIVLVVVRKKVHMYLWLILNGYWDRAVWIWSLHRSSQVRWAWWWDFWAFIM